MCCHARPRAKRGGASSLSVASRSASYRRRWARRMPISNDSSSPVTSSTNIVNRAMSPTAPPPSLEPRMQRVGTLCRRGPTGLSGERPITSADEARCRFRLAPPAMRATGGRKAPVAGDEGDLPIAPVALSALHSHLDHAAGQQRYVRLEPVVGGFTRQPHRSTGVTEQSATCLLRAERPSFASHRSDRRRA